MRARINILWLNLFFIVGCQVILGQTGQSYVLEEAKKHPDLHSDLAKAATLKIFLAKRMYHLEEFMPLDVGMLVESREESYFPNELSFRINVKDKNGNRVAIKNIESIEKIPIFERQKNTLIKSSSLLLVGCKNETIRDLYRRLDSVTDNNDARILFDSSLFRTTPENCIDINEPTTLQISVEVYNDWVVVRSGTPASKTAVGKIVSNVLELLVKK